MLIHLKKIRVIWEWVTIVLCCILQPRVISQGTELCSRWIPRVLKPQIPTTSARWVTMSFFPAVVDDMRWKILILPSMGQRCILADYFIAVFGKSLGNAIWGATRQSDFKFPLQDKLSQHIWWSYFHFDSHFYNAGASLICLCLEELANAFSAERQPTWPVTTWLCYTFRSEHYPHNEAYLMPAEIWSELVRGPQVLV